MLAAAVTGPRGDAGQSRPVTSAMSVDAARGATAVGKPAAYAQIFAGLALRTVWASVAGFLLDDLPRSPYASSKTDSTVDRGSPFSAPLRRQQAGLQSLGSGGCTKASRDR